MYEIFLKSLKALFKVTWHYENKLLNVDFCLSFESI